MNQRVPYWVYVRDFEEDEWIRRIFVGVTADGKYSCVVLMDEEAYENGYGYSTFGWNYMKEIEYMKLFRQKFFLKDL